MLVNVAAFDGEDACPRRGDRLPHRAHLIGMVAPLGVQQLWHHDGRALAVVPLVLDSQQQLGQAASRGGGIIMQQPEQAGLEASCQLGVDGELDVRPEPLLGMTVNDAVQQAIVLAFVEKPSRAVGGVRVDSNQSARPDFQTSQGHQRPGEPLLAIVNNQNRQHVARVHPGGRRLGLLVGPCPHVVWPLHHPSRLLGRAIRRR